MGTTDLRSMRDVGTMSARPPTGRAKSTNTDFKTKRNMSVGTSRTYVRDMSRLGDELDKMKGQREELERLTKQLMDERGEVEERLLNTKPSRRVVKRYVMRCACSAPPQCQCQHQRQRRHSLSSSASSSASSLDSQGSRRRVRSRVHSMIISEPEKEKEPEPEQGWHVRVLTPSKLSDFNKQFITRDSRY